MAMATTQGKRPLQVVRLTVLAPRLLFPGAGDLQVLLQSNAGRPTQPDSGLKLTSTGRIQGNNCGEWCG